MEGYPVPPHTRLPLPVIDSWRERAVGMSLPVDELPNIQYEDDRITGASRPYDLNWLAPKYAKERHGRPYYCSWFKVPRDAAAGGRTVQVGWNRLYIVDLHNPEDMCVNLGPAIQTEKQDRASEEFMKWIVRSLIYLSAAQPLMPKDDFKINMKGHVGERKKRSDCIIMETMDAGGWLSFDELLPQLPFSRDLSRDRKTAKEDWETMSKDDQERSMRMVIVALQQYGQGRIEVAANFPNRGRLHPSHYPSTIVAEAANGSRRRFVTENRKDLVEHLRGDIGAAIAADNTDSGCEFVMFRCTVAYEQTGTLPDRKH